MYYGGTLSKSAREVHALYAAPVANSTSPLVAFQTVSVDTGKVVRASPVFQAEFAPHFDPANMLMVFDPALGKIVVACFRTALLPVLGSTLRIFLVDPKSWAVTLVGTFTPPRLPFFYVEDSWTYSVESHQLIVAAGLPNTTHSAYSGAMIWATLRDGNESSPSSNSSGNVTATFHAETFTSAGFIMESLGCASDTSVVGFSVTLNPVVSTLSQWSLDDLQDVKPIGAATHEPLLPPAVWGSKAPCIKEQQLLIEPMDIYANDSATSLWMYNTSTGAIFKPATALDISPNTFLAAL